MRFLIITFYIFCDEVLTFLIQSILLVLLFISWTNQINVLLELCRCVDRVSNKDTSLVLKYLYPKQTLTRLI